VWLDSGHRVTRHDSGHWVIRYRNIWIDSGHWVIWHIRLGRDIRLKCGCRGTRLNHGRQVLRRQAHRFWILAGWYWLERIFAFFWF
ncbi:unnamed protein product, partial [Staurois parvus]